VNCIEHVFRLSTEPSFQDRARELRDLSNILGKIAQNFPKKVFCDNGTWFYNEDNQTKNDWTVIGTMLEVLEIPVQNRELGLFGFYSLKLPEKLIFQNFGFLREILLAPEETEFEIQNVNPTILQMPGSQITYFNFGHSTLEVTTDVVLVLSNDEVEDLSNPLYKNKTVWETICGYAFIRPIKYIVIHSLSIHLDSSGRIEKKYSAQINLVWKGNSE